MRPDASHPRRARRCPTGGRAPRSEPRHRPGARSGRRRTSGRCSGPVPVGAEPPVMTRPEAVDVAVVGAGQAGLSVSYELADADIEHVVLERGRVGERWRGRWDSFCLVLPNWTVRLPGDRYHGDDPDGFMPRDDVVGLLAAYARRFQAPVREGVAVLSLARSDDGGFFLHTSSGDIRAGQVVLATGGYQKPHRPPGADQLPASLHVIDAEDYTNPGALAW